MKSKRYETDLACRNGTTEIDMVINIGKALGGAGLDSDAFKRRLCEVCERAGADWVKTSTGCGFVKQPDGSYNHKGATELDLPLMRASASDRVQVKPAGGVRELDGLIRVRDLGATRCGARAMAVTERRQSAPGSDQSRR